MSRHRSGRFLSDVQVWCHVVLGGLLADLKELVMQTWVNRERVNLWDIAIDAALGAVGGLGLGVLKKFWTQIKGAIGKIRGYVTRQLRNRIPAMAAIAGSFISAFLNALDNRRRR